MSGYATYQDFNPNNLTATEPQYKSFNNGQISYNEIPLFYNYGTPEKPIISTSFLELPEVESTGIIKKEEQKQGRNGPYIKESFSLMIKFDLNNPEIVKALQACDNLHMAGSRILGQYKGKVKMFDYDPERPGNTFKHFVYYHRDQITGEKVAGRNPSLWVKLNHWENNKTLFTAPLGPNDKEPQPIDWSLLKGVELKIIPLLHIEKIYVGSKASLQIKMVSAVVTQIHKAGTVSKQVSTFERLREKRPDLADQVASQLAQLQMDRQDQLEAQRDNNFGAMHSINNGNNNTNAQDETQSMNEFLGSAPSMSNTRSQPVPQHTETPTQQFSAPQQVPTQQPTLNIQTPGTSQPTVLRIN